MSVLHGLFGWPGTWGVTGNLVAAVLCAALGAAFGWLGRDFIGRRLSAWWATHHPHRAALEEIRAHAEAAHRIAADTHEQLTGRPHPDAPNPKGTP